MEGIALIALVVVLVWGLRKLYKTPSFRRAVRDADDCDVDVGGGDD